MKICTNCKINKHIKDFYTNRNECKECRQKKAKQQRRTKQGLVGLMYSNQKKSSKERSHSLPTYSRKELQKWLFSQKEFHRLFALWEESNFNKEQTPSCNRKNDSLKYSFSNIEIITWKENLQKANKDKKSGKIITTHREVEQYSMDNIFIAKYISIREAERITKISSTSISFACKNKYKHAGNFIWQYAKNHGKEII